MTTLALPETAAAELDALLETAQEPFDLFARWLAVAEGTEPNDANAMALATIGPGGVPNNRPVLLKGHDRDGFVFYTNTQSQKGVELAANMHAAGLLHWKSLERVVRFRGPVAFVSDAEADAYFASRPRDSQIGAWASRQSMPLEDPGALGRAVEHAKARLGNSEVPRPTYWRGYRISPISVEFWTQKPHRLHDRIEFIRSGSDGVWAKRPLYP